MKELWLDVHHQWKPIDIEDPLSSQAFRITLLSFFVSVFRSKLQVQHHNWQHLSHRSSYRPLGPPPLEEMTLFFYDVHVDKYWLMTDLRVNPGSRRLLY